MSQPEIVVSQMDYDRLGNFLDRMPASPTVDLLIGELERARVLDMDDMPGNVVSMHSTVNFTVLSTGREFTYTLVYPQEVNGDESKLSILTPVGSALLGLSVGQEIEWPVAAGKTTKVRINNVVAQKAQGS